MAENCKPPERELIKSVPPFGTLADLCMEPGESFDPARHGELFEIELKPKSAQDKKSKADGALDFLSLTRRN